MSDHIAISKGKYQYTVVEAVPPTRKDLWAIFRGTYRPKVRKVTRLTSAGASRMLKKAWTGKSIAKQFYANNSFMASMKADPGKQVQVPVQRDA